MARVIHVQRARPRDAEANESHGSDTTPVVTRPRGRPARCTVEPAQPLTQPILMPAAFPSLSSDQPQPESVHEYHHHGLRHRMESLTSGAPEECSQRVAAMYDNTQFPEHVGSEQKAWYIELKGRWLPNQAPIQQIVFASLYPSLRATIIESIYREFPEGHYFDGYLLVKTILGLSDWALKDMMDENGELWNEVPPHLARLKREHPDEPIDPETPPQREIIEAIKFLQQQHLPGSLLGKWQFPLPGIEAFIVPFSTSMEEAEGRQLIFADINVSNEELLAQFQNDWDTFLNSIQRPHSQNAYITEPEATQSPLFDIDDRHLGLKPHAAAINNIRKGVGLDDGNNPLPHNLSKQAPEPEGSNITSKQISQHFYNPRDALPLSARAKMDADRLYAKHQFQEDNLTVAPEFLRVKPTSLYWQLIYTELLNNWKNAITRRLLTAAKRNTQAVLTKDYEQPKSYEADTEQRIKESYALVVEFNKKEKALPLLPDRPDVAKSAPAIQRPEPPRSTTTKPPLVPSRPRSRPTAHPEPNNGFGASTSVIPFRAPEASMAGVKRPAESTAHVTQPLAKKTVSTSSASTQLLQSASMKGRESAHVTSPYATPTISHQPVPQTSSAAATRPPVFASHRDRLAASFAAMPQSVSRPATSRDVSFPLSQQRGSKVTGSVLPGQGEKDRGVDEKQVEGEKKG